MASLRTSAISVFAVILLKGVGGSLTVSGSGGTGIPNQQALTLRCSYTVTPGDFVTAFTWRRVEDSSTVNIASGSVSAQTVVFQDSWQNKGVFVGDYTSTLDIQLPASQMNSSYAGTYRCEVSTLSVSVHADVAASVFTPPSISGLPPAQTVTEFSNTRIDCSTYTTPGNPPTTRYRWTYGGSTVSTGAVLDRRNISRNQGGDYTCTASNSQGSDSASVNVAVQYSASIRTFTANSVSGSVTVNESSTVTLICQVESNPNPVIKLVNGSQEMRRADNALTATYTLELNCRQRGNFSCTASNNIGKPVTQSVELLVQCSPRRDESVSKGLKFAATPGGDVTVVVSVLAYPFPTFIWSRSISTSQHLTGSSSPVSDISVTARLRLTNLQYQDFGDYYLTVDNGVGRSVTCTVTVVHADPPDQQNIVSSCISTGVLAGATVGTFLLTLFIGGGTVVIVLYRKGYRFGNIVKGASQKSSNHPESAEMDNRGYSSLDVPPQYSNLTEESEKQQYTQLKIYENTKAEAAAEANTYEGVREAPPVTYVSISASPYQNTGTHSQGPVHGNN